MKRLIYIVDNDKKIQNLLDYTLSNWNGYELKLFASEEDCFKCMKEKPDVVIIDFVKIASDGKNYFQTLNKLRKEDKSLPVIAISESFKSDDLKKYYNAGVSKCISKQGYFVDKIRDTIDYMTDCA
jgi:DNA-binding NtrC family response regulator